MCFVAGRAPLHINACCASSRAKLVSAGHVAHMSPQSVRSCISMVGARRIDKRWDVVKRCTEHELHSHVCHAARSALTRCRVDVCVSTERCRTILTCDPTACHLRNHWRRTHGAYRSHTDDMCALPGHVLVGEDKSSSEGWSVPEGCFQVNQFLYVANSPFWVFADMSVAEANSVLQRTLRDLVPLRLHRWLQIDCHTHRLPHMYHTVKSKCFSQEGCGRTCVKQHHSCVRKIISFACWPKRKQWQLISRAIETIIKRCSSTSEVFRLRDAGRELVDRLMAHASRARAASNYREHFHVCRRCRGPKHVWEGIVADAGQFFETVSPTEVEAAASALFKHALTLGHPGVTTVFASRSRRAYFGGVKEHPTSTHRAFSLDELFMCAAAMSRMNLAQCGDRVVRTLGLPIGGFLSKVGCSLVLGHAEHVWTHDTVRLASSGYVPHEGSWQDAAAWARYVDDSILASMVLCRSCLKSAIDESSPVAFDPTADERRLKWLD